MSSLKINYLVAIFFSDFLLVGFLESKFVSNTFQTQIPKSSHSGFLEAISMYYCYKLRTKHE